MQIKGMQIAGMPAIRVRNLLRSFRYISKWGVAEGLGVSPRKADKLIKILVSDGYLEFAEMRKGLRTPYDFRKEKPRCQPVEWFKHTDKGEELARASCVSKMPRAKAEQIVKGLMDRVANVNANEEFAFTVPTVIVEGSYARGEEFLSDVDIVVGLEKRWPEGEQKLRVQERINAAKALRGGFGSFYLQISWPEREVMLYLKARTRGLSLHPLSEFIDMTKDENFAYKVLLGEPGFIAEQLATFSQAGGCDD